MQLLHSLLHSQCSPGNMESPDEPEGFEVILRGAGVLDGASLRCRLRPRQVAKPARTLVAAFCKFGASRGAALDPGALGLRLADGRAAPLDGAVGALGLGPGAVLDVVAAARPPPPVLVLLAVCERGAAVVDANVRFFLRHGVAGAPGYGAHFDVCVVANGGASPGLRAALAALEPPPRLVERANARAGNKHMQQDCNFSHGFDVLSPLSGKNSPRETDPSKNQPKRPRFDRAREV